MSSCLSQLLIGNDQASTGPGIVFWVLTPVDCLHQLCIASQPKYRAEPVRETLQPCLKQDLVNSSTYHLKALPSSPKAWLTCVSQMTECHGVTGWKRNIHLATTNICSRTQRFISFAYPTSPVFLSSDRNRSFSSAPPKLPSVYLSFNFFFSVSKSAWNLWARLFLYCNYLLISCFQRHSFVVMLSYIAKQSSLKTNEPKLGPPTHTWPSSRQLLDHAYLP